MSWPETQGERGDHSVVAYETQPGFVFKISLGAQQESLFGGD